MKGGQEVMEGIVFELYDDNSIYIIEQIGEMAEWKFNVELYFKHNLGYIPCTYLLTITVLR